MTIWHLFILNLKSFTLQKDIWAMQNYKWMCFSEFFCQFLPVSKFVPLSLLSFVSVHCCVSLLWHVAKQETVPTVSWLQTISECYECTFNVKIVRENIKCLLQWFPHTAEHLLSVVHHWKFLHSPAAGQPSQCRRRNEGWCGFVWVFSHFTAQWNVALTCLPISQFQL